ncbi:MAG TPA: SDR family NAD(P)-dependent oxidoreductase [Pseudomonadales bacterium]|jgi:NAD(P)-dependent dehydrogenase (short-subunit alcohol dehydrogenase family)|nr:SDR family NAD(P)-dependent oxidoreductase [Pseudomonadales bacterium]
MGRLDGRIAVITGAGRGIGAEIAKLMAREGAKVVVNDLGGNTDGTGTGKIADEVVAEIRAAGGEAVSNTQSVTDVKGGESLLQTALDAFGGMDVLVNNAGILRDKTIFNMEESDWDAVMAVHLRGHYCCSRPFAKYIREQNRTNCRIVNFSSTSGLFGNFGQANYGAAKAGIAGFTRVLALELAKYGCTVNTISPGALTRMTIPLREARGEKVASAELEAGGPQHIAPIVAWLATEGAGSVSNQIFHTGRGGIGIMQQPAIIKSFSKRKGTWTLDELDRYVPQLIEARKTHDAAVKAAGKSIPID